MKNIKAKQKQMFPEVLLILLIEKICFAKIDTQAGQTYKFIILMTTYILRCSSSFD